MFSDSQKRALKQNPEIDKLRRACGWFGFEPSDSVDEPETPATFDYDRASLFLVRRFVATALEVPNEESVSLVKALMLVGLTAETQRIDPEELLAWVRKKEMSG
jgi:hypothetical protein